MLLRALILSILAVTILGCGDGDKLPADYNSGDGDGDGDVRDVVIKFGAEVGDDVFACGSTYSGVGTPARTVEPVDFRFYVYDVRMITSLGIEVPVVLDDDALFQTDGVALIDFEDGTGACVNGDAATNAEIKGEVADRAYAGIKFRIGVPLDLNHRDLATQASPLNKASLFWGRASGHVFFSAATQTMVELPEDDGGVDDTDGGAGSPTGTNVHLTHVGSTGCDGNPEGGDPVTMCTKENRAEVTLSDFDVTSQTIVADFAEVKRGSDLTTPGCESLSAASCTAPFFRLGLSFATGNASGFAQTVFTAQ